jgi:drug/metabolite transporter (DMT)-like permease
MMLYRLLPFIFVFLWSSAFVTAKIGLEYATPFAFLGVRFLITFILFGVITGAIMMYVAKPATRNTGATGAEPVLATALVGLLLHGGYLGASFFAMASGLGSAMAALIVSTQPLLTTTLAIFLFREMPSRLQWAGIGFGFCGVILALWPTLSINPPITGIMASVVALISITIGTLLHKRIGGQISLMKSNMIQAFAASLFFGALVLTVETPAIDWTSRFVFALSWQILAVSAGAYVILMIMIKRKTVAATTSYLFLVPPSTAIIAYLALNEPLSAITISGFGFAAFGVYLVTRFQKN